MTTRTAILADLRQRAVWRDETADTYRQAGNVRAAEYFAGEADGFRSAAYIFETFHPEPTEQIGWGS